MYLVAGVEVKNYSKHILLSSIVMNMKHGNGNTTSIFNVVLPSGMCGLGEEGEVLELGQQQGQGSGPLWAQQHS
jgi:hypothetical protein